MNKYALSLFLLLLSLLPIASVASAADNAVTAKPAAIYDKLSAQDHDDINRIEQYLNSMRSVQADFLQINENSQIARGTIAIKRPGKMRVNYTDPNKNFIIADGSFVHIWNDDLKSQTNVPEEASLANFILRDDIQLSGDITIVGFERAPAKLSITLEKTDDPGEGQITLVFEDHPLKLRQWHVLDAQGLTTDVSLENAQEDVSFPGNTFDFVAPDFGKSPKAEKTP